jgi:hypothetical protein
MQLFHEFSHWIVKQDGANTNSKKTLELHPTNTSVLLVLGGVQPKSGRVQVNPQHRHYPNTNTEHFPNPNTWPHPLYLKQVK